MEAQTKKTKRISPYVMPGMGYETSWKKKRVKYLTSEQVKHIVARYFGLPVFTLDIKTRKITIKEPRQIAHYFSTLYTRDSLAVIGKEIGAKDHATVLHSAKTIKNLIDTDPKVRDWIEDIEQLIKKRLKELRKGR